jgi:ankyrin
MQASDADPHNPQFMRFLDAIRTGNRDATVASLRDQPGWLNHFSSEPAAHGPEMWLPLHHAAHTGHTSIVRLLLEQGASPDCRTRFQTPTHGRATPLHLAVSAGHVGVVEALVAAGAELDVLDAALCSPLHLAARHGHPDLVSKLIKAGASLELRNSNDRTALHEAIRSSPDVEDKAANACAIFLIDAHADVNATCPKEPEGYTPLHRCACTGELRRPVMQRLLEAGADRMLRDPRRGHTAQERWASQGLPTNW